MEQEHVHPKMIFKNHMKFMKYLGVGMYKETREGSYSNFPHWKYKMYTTLTLGIGVVLMFLLEFAAIFEIQDFDKLTFHLSLLPSQMLNTVKTFSLVYYSREVIKVIRTVETVVGNMYVTKKHLNLTNRNIMRLSKVYVVLIFSCVFNFAMPAYDVVVNKEFYFDANKTVAASRLVDVLPVRIATPFQIDNGVTFTMVSLYQMATLMYETVLTAAVDSLAAGILMHLANQFVTVQLMFTNIKRHAMILLQHEKRCARVNISRSRLLGPLDVQNFISIKASSFGYDLDNDCFGYQECLDNTLDEFSFSVEELSDAMELFVIDAIKLNEITIGCCNTLSFFFKYGLAGQLITSVVVMCMTLYQLIGMKPDVAQLVIAVCMMTVFTPQLALFTWNCTKITLEAEKVATAVYCGFSPRASRRLQNLLLGAMSSSQRPCVISTFASLVPLSNEVFVEIMKRSYSAFAVLVNFKN